MAILVLLYLESIGPVAFRMKKESWTRRVKLVFRMMSEKVERMRSVKWIWVNVHWRGRLFSRFVAFPSIIQRIPLDISHVG